MCWDNFDIREETSTGSGTTHITHFFLVQELEPSVNVSVAEAELSCSKTTARSFHYSQPAPEACYTKNKASPVEYVPHER